MNRRRSMEELLRWPGDHYRLLAALVKVLQAKRVVEIGTDSGASALAMKLALSRDGVIDTFDIVEWKRVPHPVLEERDFADGRLRQHIADVSQPHIMEQYRDIFEAAEFIFLDAAKDGSLEQRLFDLFEGLAFRHAPILMLDDIRIWKMLKIWRNVRQPKLDLTSFGHWRGTGLVELHKNSRTNPGTTL